MCIWKGQEGGVREMANTELQVDVLVKNMGDIDELIEKANRLVVLLREAQQLIGSLAVKNDVNEISHHLSERLKEAGTQDMMKVYPAQEIQSNDHKNGIWME